MADDAAGRYFKLTRQFSLLTALTHPISGRCCERVHGPRSQPHCCYQVSHQRAPEQVTLLELALIGGGSTTTAMLELRREGWRLGRAIDASTVEMRAERPRLAAISLHYGLASKMLENAAHPTRPVVEGENWCGGVAVVTDCLAGWQEGLDHLHDRRWELDDLWREAVALTGTKPYYPTTTDVDRRSNLDWLTP